MPDTTTTPSAPAPRARVEPDAHSPSLFAHFVLQTANYEAVRDWYLTVLNAQVVYDRHDLCFLTYDDEHHRLAIRHVPGLRPPRPGSWGLHHLAYAYPTLRALLSTYLRLKNQGIRPYWTINHGPTLSFYYRDPDGTQIELQVDNFRTKEEAAAFFHGDDFAVNPVGIKLDPEALIRAYEAGVPEAELARRPRMAPGQTLDDMRPGETPA